MPNVRPLNKKYKISKPAFLTAYYYCLQYNELLEKLGDEVVSIKSPKITGMPGTHTLRDPTAEAAERGIKILEKIRIIENAAWEASEKNVVLYKYLIDYVTTEGSTFNQLKQRGMPCGRKFFYEMRRCFYYLISQKI